MAELSREAISRIQVASHSARLILERAFAKAQAMWESEYGLLPSEHERILNARAASEAKTIWTEIEASRGRPYVRFEDFCARGPIAMSIAGAREEAARVHLGAVARELSSVIPLGEEQMALDVAGEHFRSIKKIYGLTDPQGNVVWEEIWAYPGIFKGTVEQHGSAGQAGRPLKELRIEAGLTQEDLAGKSKLAPRTILRIENGGTASIETLNQLAAALSKELGREILPSHIKVT